MLDARWSVKVASNDACPDNDIKGDVFFHITIAITLNTKKKNKTQMRHARFQRADAGAEGGGVGSREAMVDCCADGIREAMYDADGLCGIESGNITESARLLGDGTVETGALEFASETSVDLNAD
jgi:hypothetical protein